MQDVDLDLAFLVQALQFADDRVDGTGDVRLKDQAELFDIAFLRAFEEVLQCEFLFGLVGGSFGLAGLHDRAGFLFRGVNLENVTG